MIRVEYSDFHVDEYDDEEEAINNILEAHAEGVGVEWVEDTITGKPYSLVWDVALQEES
jgi:hypothetical protein